MGDIDGLLDELADLGVAFDGDDAARARMSCPSEDYDPTAFTMNVSTSGPIRA
ncbi:hypothetical protein HDF11_000594 [Tunturiibacter psychrotolerans]